MDINADEARSLYADEAYKELLCNVEAAIRTAAPKGHDCVVVTKDYLHAPRVSYQLQQEGFGCILTIHTPLGQEKQARLEISWR